MEFSSLEFLFRFLPIFLIIYYLVPVKYKNPVLFFGSLVFYAMGSWKDALLFHESELHSGITDGSYKKEEQQKYHACDFALL